MSCYHFLIHLQCQTNPFPSFVDSKDSSRSSQNLTIGSHSEPFQSNQHFYAIIFKDIVHYTPEYPLYHEWCLFLSGFVPKLRIRLLFLRACYMYRPSHCCIHHFNSYPGILCE
jgi:hypothetical protein